MRDLERLSQMEFLAARLGQWRRDGWLPVKVAERAFEQIRQERSALIHQIDLGRNLTPESVELPAVPTPVAAPTSPVRRPAFSWSGLALQLLSEQTLNALLALGALLILASGIVISLFNPTGLSHSLHLMATVVTALVLYGSGLVARLKLRLVRAGSALLTLGAAFIPLAVWAVGQTTQAHWTGADIWLVASLLCLPVYLATHATLRDRPFAVLATNAVASFLLAAAYHLGAPVVWEIAALVPVATAYLVISQLTRERDRSLAWALSRVSQVGVPVVMLGLMVGRFFPHRWETTFGAAPGSTFDYAVGAAWWLGVAFFILAARILPSRRYAYIAAGALVLSYVFSLTRAPWSPVWHPLALALLAAAMIIFGEVSVRRTRESSLTPARLLLEPVKRISVFGPAALVTGYLIALLAVSLTIANFATLGEEGVGAVVVLAPLTIVLGIAALSTVTRRSSIFLYPATFLLPVWVLFTLSLLPNPAPVLYGVALTVLAPIFVTAGRREFGGVSPQFRFAWYVPGYAMSVVGPLATLGWGAADIGAIAVSVGLYITSARTFRQPAWLYPACIAALSGFAAMVIEFRPGMSLVELAALFAIPVFVLAGLGYGISRRSRIREMWRYPWSTPLFVVGALTAGLSAAGAASDPGFGLAVGAAYLGLLAILTAYSVSELPAWGMVAAIAFTTQEMLRFVGVPIVAQPLVWAGCSFVSVAAAGLLRGSISIWRRPLLWGALAVAGFAPLVSAQFVAFVPNGAHQHMLAAVAGLSGLAFAANALLSRSRLWGYLGGMGMEAALMIELAARHNLVLQAFAVPAGASLLAAAWIEWRAGSDKRIKFTLETSALVLLLGTSLLEATGLFGLGGESYAFDGFLLIESLVIFGLGAGLHWRKPFLAGAGGVVADLLILLSNPMRAMNTWYVVALVGFVMIGLVVFLEQRRNRIPLWVDWWRQRIESWA